MKTDITNLLTNASINGYYDPSVGLVVVWFHKTNDDNDVVAYLQKDMVWDLREVLSETSTIHPTKEVVVIEHRLVDKFDQGSSFDVALRKMLDQLIEHAEKEDSDSHNLSILKNILKDNSYNKVNN